MAELMTTSNVTPRLDVPAAGVTQPLRVAVIGCGAVSKANLLPVLAGHSGVTPQSKHTTHFSVTDAAGNAVSLTTTLNSGFGSAVTVDGAGFILNNEMDDFAVQPGSPNQYGLVQGEANAIAPGKRMLSSMTPLIVAGRGQPALDQPDSEGR